MDGDQLDRVQITEDRSVSKSALLYHLKTYNLYYEGQSLQLRHREEEGELVVEGLLNIFWGLQRPIRLQMQDDKPQVRGPLSSLSRMPGRQRASDQGDTKQEPPTIEVTAPEERSDENTGGTEQDESVDQSSLLLRTMSDVGGRRSGTRRTVSDQRRIRRHRCSINGHFYNHKTAVFTPAYGSVTNVRINSCMTTPQVIRVLLNKFKIENSPEEFALFIVHTSGERVQLRQGDHPLAIRVMEGPCEQVSKILLLEKDLGEEVTYDVAQYIKFEMPVLQSFVTKLKEEEDRELQNIKSRYSSLRCLIEKHMTAPSPHV